MQNCQPRSRALSPLPPFAVGGKYLLWLVKWAATTRVFLPTTDGGRGERAWKRGWRIASDKHIFYLDISTENFRLPFKTFSLLRKFSGCSSRNCLTICILTKNVWNFWENNEQPFSYKVSELMYRSSVCISILGGIKNSLHSLIILLCDLLSFSYGG